MSAIIRKLTSALTASGLGILSSLNANAQEKVGTAEILPLLELAGSTMAVVAQRLGGASRCEMIRYGLKCFYKAGAIEIVFIDGRADWFTVTPENAAYLPSSLTQLGLPSDRTPVLSTNHVLRWTNLEGLQEVTAFPDGTGRVRYFYVKARTQ